MHIDIITCHPGLLEGAFSHSIVKRAQEKQKVSIAIHNLRTYSQHRHKSVDDYPFGGGSGMVLMIEPIDRCIAHLKTLRTYDDIIYLSPDGIMLTQPLVNKLSLKNNLLLLCGHYKGIDERVRQHLITREISIGDYVLSGGEPAAGVLTDSIVRLIPGVLSDETSALTDSFQDNLVAPPIYTRPAIYKNWAVPDILLTGNTAKVAQWQHEKALERTQQRRPGLLNNPQ